MSKDPAKGQKLVAFLKWVFQDSKAQDMAKGLNYAPIPDVVVKRVMAAIDTIK